MIKGLSKEVIRRALADVRFVLSGGRIELKEGILHEFVDLHDGSLVTTAVAIVGSREDSDHVPFMSPIVAIHHQLMSSGYQLKAISMVKLLGDVLAERVAGTSGRDTPATSVIRVGPKQVADRSLVRNLLNSVELSDLVERVDRRRETTVEAEDLAFNHCGQGQVIK